MSSTMTSGAMRRRIRSAGRAVYWRLPPRWRDAVVELAFRYAGPLFRGIGRYELWRQRRTEGDPAAAAMPGGRLTDVDPLAPLAHPPGRIAIHAHLYYADLAGEFAAQLRHMPFAYDLFVSAADESGLEVCRKTFVRLPRLGALTLEVVPNRGRDIAPMLCTFGPVLKTYDFIAHIHSKKSLYNKGATDGWRHYLLNSLLGSEARIRRILGLLADGAGMAFPQNYAKVPYAGSTWLANRAAGTAWCRRLGVRTIPRSGYFDFPIGSMFWARTDALRPLFDGDIRLDDFPPESGQLDGTFAHVVERLLGIVARDSGQRLAILRDTATPSWSPWRFEQYLARGRAASEAMIAAPEIRVVIFDIFDTLLLRPLLDPEQLKAVVARRAGGEAGAAYLRWRAEAEAAARERAGRDVDLGAIFDELARSAGLAAETVRRLRALEVDVEAASVALRPGAFELLRHALTCGKRVVLASDMFLPQAAIEAMLARHGLVGWHQLYVSSSVGLRKDTGALYDHILGEHGVTESEVMVIGDNERSDLQIPGDRGMRTLHLLRPVELARGMLRLAPLVEQVEAQGGLEADLALGLVIRECFGKIFPERFEAGALVPEPSADALGYAVAGPLVCAFTQWLIERSRADGIARLHFLAREGEFLKTVYDRVTQTIEGAPRSNYLVLSRRAVNVPALSSIEDVCSIAATSYGPGTLEDFLSERFGVVLTQAEMDCLGEMGVWRPGRMVEIREGDIGHLEPLLESLLPAILRQGERERPALLAYLRGQGLPGGERCAVVDVGYAATIQRRLNALVGGPVDGYYMATFDHTASIESRYGAQVAGCYFHRAPDGMAAPRFIRESFLAEKLLSADQAQLIRYSQAEDGTPVVEFRALSAAELATREVRAAIRAGALRFVDDVLAIRRDLLPDFVFPAEVALGLFEALLDGASPTEQALLATMVLDDHYCGRGVVA